MKFIDIQQQYQRYRSDIDARMHQVLEGPNSSWALMSRSLKECWQIMLVRHWSPMAVEP